MSSTVVKLSIVVCLLVTLLGSPTAGQDSDTVQVSVNTDDFDGTIAVPRWVLYQAAASSLGMVSNNNWSYDDDTLPSSIRMDSDNYEIRVDLTNFDRDRTKVKVLDSQTIRVEARQRYVNRYGTSTSRNVNRRFTVPKTYDVYSLEARINKSGILTITVPSKNGNGVSVSNDGERTIKISY